MPDSRYLVAARKYRPQLFGELVAQEHVTETLKNAIRLDRLAHAYLFSGPRGVGKTTAARILAKAINCTTPPEERADRAEPCRSCDSCRSFEEGRSLNIIEIDAASNNKVDDIRELRETVRVPPQGSRKKVYIIDEVHMLSTSAFNALLKTLEEPPPYVLFIFATTEPHKVLATILSRCQRFDFRRIPVPDIVARLEEICQEEGITADEAALLLLARKGDGALRDALSAFDQAVSLCGTDLRYAELAEALGVVDVDLFFEVTRHVQDRSAAGMLRLVDRIVRAGYDLQEFLSGLAEHLRNALVACTMPDVGLIEATEAVRARYAELGGRFREADLLRLLMIAAEAEEGMGSSTQPRLRLEMALLKMASLAQTADLRDALAKLDRLEKMAREGRLPTLPDADATSAPPAPEPAPPAPKPLPPRDEASDVRLPSQTEQTSAPTSAAPSDVGVTPFPAEAPPRTAAPEAPTDVPDVPPTPDVAEEPQRPAARIHPMRPRPEPTSASAAPTSDAQTSIAQTSEPSNWDEPEDEAEPGQAAPSPDVRRGAKPAADVSPEPGSERSAAGYLSLFGTPALQKRKPQNAAPRDSGGAGALFDGSGALAVQEAPAEDAAVAEPLLRRITAAWDRCVAAVKRERIHVGALLQHARPDGVRGDVLLLAVPDDFHRRFLQVEEDFLLGHLEGALGEAVASVRFVIQETLPTGGDAVADVFDAQAYMERKRKENPVVRAIFEQFGGELVW